MKKWLILILPLLIGTGCKEERTLGKKAVPESMQTTESQGHTGWYTDFEEANTQAQKKGKHILIDFSGSDWCSWCIKLDKEVFSKKIFKDYAKENLILVLADFPHEKSKQSAELQEQNKKLAEKFDVNGFPTVFILNPDGAVVEKTGYRQGGAEAYIKHIEEIIAGEK